MDAGFPDVAGLTREIRRRLPELEDETGIVCPAFSELFEFIARHDPDSRDNYERFFEWIAFIQKVNNHPFRELATLNLPQGLSEAALKLARVIADPIRNTLSKCHQALYYEPSYLTRLEDFLPKNGRLDVYTTNYDLSVEDALSGQGIDFTTGFCRETKEWFPSLFRACQQGINLHKMHGSLNWHHQNGEMGSLYEVYPPVWNQGSRSELVLGPRLKLQHDEPFVTLYSKFHKTLRKSRVCVIIGCGLQDDHIREPLKQATWKGVHVINVGPEVPPSGYENGWGFKNGFYQTIQSKAKDALLNGEIQEKFSSII